MSLKSSLGRLLPHSLVAGLHRRKTVAMVRREMKRHAGAARRAHGLPAPLIVSLTSFPPRFATLHLSLRGLLQQSLAPDSIVLWIAGEDYARLPPNVLALIGEGIEIRRCSDVRSYKKLVFTLEAFPGAFIVTADDDVYYPRDWLETLVGGVKAGPGDIVCHRAHRLKLGADGKIAPYLDWEEDVQDEAARRPSTDLVPVGVGGTLYPPHSLAPLAADRATYMALSPSADDLWFYWMARRAGTRHRKVGGRFRQIHWPQSQTGRLFETNAGGGNDRQVAALEAALGSPLADDSRPDRRD